MPIRVQCQCGKLLAAPDSAAGKRVKCASCGTTIDVPFESQAPSLRPERQPKAEPGPPARTHRRRPGRRGAPPALIAGIVFVVLAGVITILFIVYVSPHYSLMPRPGRTLLRHFQAAVAAGDDDTLRNLMTVRFCGALREGLQRRHDETYVAAWMRTHRATLQALCTSTYSREDVLGDGKRRKVTCTTPVGTTLHFHVALSGGQCLFDGFE